jgi:aspartate aminotransferase
VSAFLGGRSVDELCDWLLEKHGVATVTGSAFGAPNSLRLSFATNEVDLEKALNRISAGLSALD